MGKEPNLNPDTFTTESEFDDALEHIDRTIRTIESQVLEAKGLAKKDRVYSDPSWWSRVNYALKRARAQRSAMQNRRGVFTRAQKKQVHGVEQGNRQRVFIDLCREMMSREQWLELWRRVDERIGAYQANGSTSGDGIPWTQQPDQDSH